MGDLALTKDEAHREALRRWRELPIMNRQTHEQAAQFAASLAAELDFHTMGNRERIVAAWLVRDIAEREEVRLAMAARAAQPG